MSSPRAIATNRTDRPRAISCKGGASIVWREAIALTGSGSKASGGPMLRDRRMADRALRSTVAAGLDRRGHPPRGRAP